MIKIFQVCINTNILIAAAAVFQCLLTYLIIGFDANLYILLIEGSSTLLLYNFSLFLSKPSNPQNSPYQRTRWVFSHMPIFWSFSILSGLLLLYALWHIHYYTIFYLVFIGVLSVLYSFPFLNRKGRKAGLRHIPGLKVFFIALLWSLSSVGLPVVELWAEGDSVDWSIASYLGLLKMLFILLCTLPFDIRDIKQDSYYDLKTLPTMLGEYRSKVLCYILLAVHSFLIIVSPYPLFVIAGLLWTNLVIGLLYRFVVFDTKPIYSRVYLLDVVLVFQYALVVLMSCILYI